MKAKFVKRNKTKQEKIYYFLGQVFAMILFVIPFILMFDYGIMHATTLN